MISHTVDDFLARRRHGVAGLRIAVDAFVRTNFAELSIEFVNRQVGIRKFDDPAAAGSTFKPGPTLLEPDEYEGQGFFGWGG